MVLQLTSNSVESEELRSAGVALLEECLVRIDNLRPRLEAIRVDPTSSLAEDDRWTTCDPISWQAIHSASAGLDHLGMLRRYTEQIGAPSMPGYTLIRTSIEASSLGIWLLSRDSKNSRAISSMRLAWLHVHDLDALKAAVDPSESTLDEDVRKIEACRAARSSLANRSLNRFPKWSDIVSLSEAHSRRTHALGVLQAWRIASAFTHSSKLAQQSFLQHQAIPQIDGSISYTWSTRLSTLGKFVEVATNHSESLLEWIERKSKPKRQGSH